MIQKLFLLTDLVTTSSAVLCTKMKKQVKWIGHTSTIDVEASQIVIGNDLYSKKYIVSTEQMNDGTCCKMKELDEESQFWVDLPE